MQVVMNGFPLNQQGGNYTFSEANGSTVAGAGHPGARVRYAEEEIFAWTLQALFGVLVDKFGVRRCAVLCAVCCALQVVCGVASGLRPKKVWDPNLSWFPWLPVKP